MLKKYTHSTIIVMTQIILPVVLFLLLAPQLFQFHHELTQANHFLLTHKIGFLIAHILLYLILFWLWPRFIDFYVHRSHHEITTKQVQFALSAKWYLLSAMIFFELLVWWR